MLSATILSLLLIGACAISHYEALKWLNDHLSRTRIVETRAKVLVALGGAMASHPVHIALFAAAYCLLRDKFGLGAFGGKFEDTFASFLYFSGETYTTLGLGDIYPVGQLRLVSGIETLTGLLMISWIASFTYLEMRRNW